MPAKFGCAYWGRDYRMADQDLSTIANAGMEWIVVPVSTERMRFDHKGTSRIIQAAKDYGLHTRLAPWGVGGLFGGEGVQDGTATQLGALKAWLNAANDLDADSMLWDEPQHLYAVFAMHVAQQTNPVPEEQYLYINPDRCPWPDPSSTEGMAGIGIDAYRGVERAITMLPEARDRYGLPVHVWVKSFGISPANTLQPAYDVRSLVEAGAEDIGIWGFPSAGCSILDNGEPSRTWNNIVAAIRDSRGDD